MTYPEVGATIADLPPGYKHTRLTMPLGSGQELYERASEALVSWYMHRRAGLTVESTGRYATTGAEVVLGWGLGRLRMRAPCLVVLTVHESGAQGFAYGTLPGHPERGEELFVVRIDDGLVRLDIVAFSRPARWYSRLGSPVANLVQRRITRRYLVALRDA